MSEAEKGYNVQDKRRVKLGENGEVEVPETDEQAKAESEPKEAQTESPESAGLPDIDVDTMLRSFMSLLSMHAWHWMGLIKNPATGQIDKDLAQAKIAIDTIAAMADQLNGRIPEAEQRELQSMLSDLRINFVQQRG
jgi:hypothetical protein